MAERAEYDAWSREYDQSFGEPAFVDMSAADALGAPFFDGARDNARCGFDIIRQRQEASAK